MALQVLDGFDVYRSFFPGESDSVYDSGWSLTQSQTNPAYFVNEFSAVNGVGRWMTLASYSQEYNYISKPITAGSSYCAGVLVKRYLSNTEQFGEVDSIIGLYSADKSEYVRIGVAALPSGGFYLKTSDSGTKYPINRPVGLTQQFYLELEVAGTSVSCYVNGHLEHTITMGTAITFSNVRIGGRDLQNSPYRTGFSYDNCYVTDFSGAEFVGRLGPITLVPFTPTSDGVVGTDFLKSPDTLGKYDKIDDYASGGESDVDATYIHALSDGDTQTVLCTPELTFSGEALGYVMLGSCKSENPTDSEVILLSAKGGSELESAPQFASIGQYSIVSSEVFTALPDAALMTSANLQAAEFGVRLTQST